MPSATFSHTARLAVPLDRAWRRLQAGDTWEAIAGIDRVFDTKHRPDGTLESYRFSATAGGVHYQGSATVRAVESPHQMVLDIESSEVTGWISTVLTGGNPDSGIITVTVSLETRGILSAVLFPVLVRVVEDGLPSSVEDFVSRLADGA